MKKILLLAATFAAMFTTNLAMAESIKVVSQEQREGMREASLSGRVVNENGSPLPGAVVYIKELDKATAADVHGYFYLSQIASGEHTVEVRYIGCDTYSTTMNFKESEASNVVIDITEGINVGNVEVVGIVSGRRKAMQQQMSNDGVSNVISSDQMERFPDDNIGDALKRIPGINVQYDQGEARFGQVRGTSPDLTSVTVNGNRTPSAEGGSRAAQLDLIPAEMIQTVEVSKVVTSDMDADAIGGSVNLVTRSAPSQMMVNGSLGAGYNPIANKVTYNGSVAWGDRFIDDKLGVMAAVSYSNNPAGSDNVEAEWKLDDNNDPYLKELQNRQYFVHRERQSYSLSADYQFNANHKIEAKAMYNRRNDWENRYRLKMKLNKDMDEVDIERETKGGGEDQRFSRLERQQTTSFNLAGEHKFNRLKMNWDVDYSTASELRPDERYITFENKNADATTDLSDLNNPKINFSEADGDIDNYDFDKVEQSFQDIQEHEVKASVKFRYDISSGAFGNALKFGYKLQNKDKFLTKNYYKIKPTDSYEDEFVASALAHVKDQTRDNYMAGDYRVGKFVEREFLGNLALGGANDSGLFGDFNKSHDEVEEAENYTGNETIHAAFVRFDQNLGDKLKMIAGMRMEHTSLYYTGNEFELTGPDSDGEYGADVTAATPNDRNMTNWLPSLLFKYNPTKNMVLRASYTSTISRPKFSDLVPGSVMEVDKDALEKIKVGNPDLNNTVSNNFDLMAELYTKNAGLISFGVYYKQIGDFITEATLKDADYNGNEWEEYKKSVNGGDAYILGFEAAVQQDFSFISSALKNFGIYANYTYNHSKVTKVKDELLMGQDINTMSLPGTPKHIANASLYYENHRVSAALSYNFASSFLDEVGESEFYNRYYDSVNYLDVNVSVKVGRHVTIFGEVNNLLNQPLRYYQGADKNRVMQMEYYGLKTQFGAKVRF